MNNLWKIERDSYYRDLYKKYGWEYIDRHGFFFDSNENNIDIQDTVNILCTPFGSLSADTIDDKTCILVTTGGFAPIHDGHISMMKAAKEAVEADGWKVACGYFAPDHDHYVGKKCGDKAIDIFSRIGLINEATVSLPWLTVDPWAALYGGTNINFTDVVDRLSAYLEHHIGKKVMVFYVCGGDNARFSAVFESRGGCVVAGRPRYRNEFFRYKSIASDLKAEKRIYFVDCNIDICSTEIRDKGVEMVYKKQNLILLDDGHSATKQVADVLKDYFTDIEIIEKNESSIASGVNSETIISLDKSICAKYQLSISRQYDFLGIKNKGYVHRPGCKTIDQQINLIPAGTYSLFDSDIHTGGTVSFAINTLRPHGIEIKNAFSILDHKGEILDADDFILDNGQGLVVADAQGKSIRVPYVLPYVMGLERCSVMDSVALAKSIWAMNLAYFKNRPKKVCDIGNMKDIFVMAGFSLDEDMRVVCQWHLDLFR